MHGTINNYNNDTITLSCSFETHYTTHQSRIMMRVLSAFIFLTMLLMAILNGYVAVAMATYKQMSGRRISMVLLLILVLIDLVCSLTFMPIYITTAWMLSIGRVSCPVHRTVHIFGHALCMLTMLTILFITIQLYLAVVKPFVYQGHHNAHYYWLYLVATWGVSFLMIFFWIFLYPGRWGRFKKIIGTSFVAVVFAVICLLHVHIHNEVKSIMRKGSNNPTLTGTSASSVSSNQKTIRMTALVVAVFGCCYLPFALITIYEFIVMKSGIEYSRIPTLYIHPWIELAGISNGVWNPVIYCFRLSFIKRRRSFLVRILTRKRNQAFRTTTAPSIRTSKML